MDTQLPVPADSGRYPTERHTFATTSMTEPIAHTIHIAILIAMIAGIWLLPRAFGLLGLIAAHFCSVFGVLSMGCVSNAANIGPAYEPIELFGYVVQGVIFNILMLPLSIWAMIRWRRLSPLSPAYVPPAVFDDCGHPPGDQRRVHKIGGPYDPPATLT